MIRYILLVLILSIHLRLSAQEKYYPLPHIEKESPFDIAAHFPGGSNQMMKYFADSVRYPEPEKSNKKQGNVLLKFEVTETGKVENIRAINGVAGAPNFVAEAIRMMEAMPLWNPATKEGKTVKSDYTLSVPFRLQKKYNTYKIEP